MTQVAGSVQAIVKQQELIMSDALRIADLERELRRVKALAKTALDAHNAEAKALRSWEVARENFSQDRYEAKAYERAALAASEADRALLAAITGD